MDITVEVLRRQNTVVWVVPHPPEDFSPCPCARFWAPRGPLPPRPFPIDAPDAQPGELLRLTVSTRAVLHHGLAVFAAPLIGLLLGAWGCDVAGVGALAPVGGGLGFVTGLTLGWFCRVKAVSYGVVSAPARGIHCATPGI